MTDGQAVTQRGFAWMGAGLLLAAAAAMDAAAAGEAMKVPTPAEAAAVTNTPDAKQEAKKLDELPPVPVKSNKIEVDHSGRKEAGKASIYSESFDGKTMADGKKLDTDAPVAASKTLPLGTIAKVTNLENGKSTEVKVEDRGPFVAGRVVDLTPKAAKDIGLTEKEGVAPVVVAPVVVPQKDGGLKVGAGAAEPTHPPAEREAQAGRAAE